MPPPYVAVVVRNPDGNAEEYPTLSPSQLNERLHEVIAPQKAPDPVRYGDTPARPARMPMYSVLAKRQIRAVMADAQSGVMGKRAFALFVSSPHGESLTWDERANIEHVQPESYGGQFMIRPNTQDEEIRREMGV